MLKKKINIVRSINYKDVWLYEAGKFRDDDDWFGFSFRQYAAGPGWVLIGTGMQNIYDKISFFYNWIVIWNFNYKTKT